jgi:hypothetical protein
MAEVIATRFGGTGVPLKERVTTAS